MEMKTDPTARKSNNKSFCSNKKFTKCASQMNSKLERLCFPRI